MELLPEQLKNIASLTETARSCQLSGEFAEVESICHRIERQCQTVLQKYSGQSGTHRYCANVYNNIAAIYKSIGKDSNAKNILKKAISVDPRFVPAINNLGLLSLDENKLTDAEKRFKAIISIDPYYVEAHNNLGSVLQLKNHIDEAIQCFEKAIELNPQYVQAYYNLAVIYESREMPEQAIVYYKRALAINNRYFDALFNLGAVLQKTGAYEEAFTKLTESSILNPENPAVYLQLGDVSRALDRIDGAIKYYQLAVQLDDQCPEAFYGLGITYHEKNKYSDAINAFARAAELEPDSPETQFMLGVVFFDIHRYDEAERAFKEAIILKPDFAKAYNNLWSIYRMKGDPDAALECCRKALEIDPDYSHAHLNFARSSHYSRNNLEHVEQIERLLEQNNLTDENKIHFHFALGTIYDDIGEHKKAFFHFNVANELKNSQLKYDYRKHSENVTNLVSVFTDTFLEKHKQYGHPSRKPVFIVGMPRSGTTLVEQIIASHPQAQAGGELPLIHFFEDMASRYLESSLPYPQVIHDMDEKTANFLANEYLQTIQTISADAERVTDKMPSNFLSVGFIKLLFPDAYIIHCMRHPLDTCLSIYSLLFVKGNKYAYDLVSLGHYYRDYARIMEHWRSLNSVSMFEIQYEELVENPENLSKKLINYIDLEWDERCLSFYKKKGYVRTASSEQVRRPIYTTSVNRWKNYESCLSPLIEIIESP